MVPTPPFLLKHTPWGYIIQPNKPEGKKVLILDTNPKALDNNESAHSCCGDRKKHRSEQEYKDLIRRLNMSEGQVRGIRGMLEQHASCIDILTQASAVSCAMNSFSKELLSNHIRTCVKDDILNGKDESVNELVATLQKLMK